MTSRRDRGEPSIARKEGKKTQSESVRPEEPRLQVEVGDQRRPFMRGIMVHSLMERGVPFESAYRTAEEVRNRVRDRGVVSPGELTKLVREILGDDLHDEAPMAPLGPHGIMVTTATRSLPFSKATLSQSVLAASLDPNDAFDVAREIEFELVRAGEFEISRKQLRRRVFQKLLDRFGSKTADRFLAWRHYQEPDRPVIVLLGGTTGAGKTSLALEVARRLGIRRVLSTDSIRQIMRIMLSPELIPAIHASSFDAHRHLAAASTEHADDPELEGFLAQASLVSVGVRAMIDRAVSENTSLVLDGVTLVPGIIDLEAYRDDADVIFLVVATLDEEAFAGRFESRGDRQARRGTHRYLENLDGILRIQNHFLELADRYDVPIVDNVSIDNSVRLIIRHVVDTLCQKGEYPVEESL